MQDGVRVYWALAAGSAIAMAYVLYRLFSSVNRDRFVTDTPLVRIRSAAQGYVRMEGRAGVAAGESLAAPLSARPCVWWDYKVSIKETDSRGNSRWSALESATSVAPFTLTDADGTCLVGPVGAEVTPDCNDTWYGDTPHPVAPPAQDGWIGSLDHTYRYNERLLQPGMRLSVLGELRSHAQEAEVEAGTRAVLAGWKNDQQELLGRFDSNHDGKIDPGEWETARDSAHQQAQGAVANARLERISVVAQPTHGQPFLIAPLDGKQLAHRERRNARLFLAAAIALLVLSAWSVHKARQPVHEAVAYTGSRAL